MAILPWRRKEHRRGVGIPSSNPLPSGGLGLDVQSIGKNVGLVLRDTRIIPGRGDPTGACCVEIEGITECLPDKTEQRCLQDDGEWIGPNTTCDPNPCTGACCLGNNNATCVPNQTQADCEVEGGIFVGVGTGCVPDPCDTTPGACCFGENCVRDQTQAECQGEGGVWQGPGVPCDPNPCLDPDPEPGGACCVGEICHPNETEESCCLRGGDWQGPAVPCFPNPCGETAGSCCTGPNFNTCVPNVTRGKCCVFNGGVGHWNGPGSTCGPPDPCNMPPTVGACCCGTTFPQTCTPNQTSEQCLGESDCQWYPGEPCTPPQCLGEPPTVGACCELGSLPQACHEDWTQVQCAAIDGRWFAGQPCTPPECEGEPPETGACCPSPGNVPCIISTEADCDGGYLGDGTNCGPPDPCIDPTSGICCIGPAPPGGQETCVEADNEASCKGQGGTWHPGIPNCGPPNPCPFGPALEACCMTGSGAPGQPEDCFEFTPQDCELFDGVPQGPGSTCTPNLCPIHPFHGACCFPEPVPPPGDQQQCVDDIHELECIDGGGVWQGDNTDCFPNPCPSTPIGACCFGQECVSNLTEEQCLKQDGRWIGNPNGLPDPCDPNPCGAISTPGACCAPPGITPAPDICIDDLSREECERGEQGIWQGPGTVCAEIDCNETGACCFPSGSCIDDQTQSDCKGEGGQWMGPGTLCADVTCIGEAIDCCLPDCTCLMVGDDAACLELGGEPHFLGFCAANLCCVACCRFIQQDCVDARTCFDCEQGGHVCLGEGTSCATHENDCEICCCLGETNGEPCGPIVCPQIDCACTGRTSLDCDKLGGVISVVNCCILP